MFIVPGLNGVWSQDLTVNTLAKNFIVFVTNLKMFMEITEQSVIKPFPRSKLFTDTYN